MLVHCPQSVSLSLHSLQPMSSRKAQGCITCFPDPQIKSAVDKKIKTSGKFDSNTPKHNSKVTGMVVKADKGTLRQPQKISTPPTSGSIFWSALASLPPNLCQSGIMFYCILRRRLAGWWLVAYIHSSARFRLSHIGGSVPLFSLRLLWLECSLGKLPF